MADIKISELPPASSVGATDIVPIVQAGQTKKATVSLFQSFLKFIGLDFTGNNLTFMNGTTMWKSTGDSNSIQTSGTLIIGHHYTISAYFSPDDFTNVGGTNASGATFTATGTTPTTWTNQSILYEYPYTYLNSGIVVRDANNAEILRIWATDPVNDSSLYIGSGAGANAEVSASGGEANVAVGAMALNSVTTGNDITAIGAFTGGPFLITGSKDVFIGEFARAGNDVTDAVDIGFNATVSGDKATAIGSGARADTNAIALGYGTNAGAFTAQIGNTDVTDVYFGNGNATLHGKGDAIVFPDSDPHIAGAGYWSAGVLHRSAG